MNRTMTRPMVEGRVIVRHHPWGIIVLCPNGHQLCGTTDMKSFAGSAFEVKVSDPNWRARCNGDICETVR